MFPQRQDDRGFTLIAVLLLIILIGGLTASLMWTVNTETRIGGTDLENRLAYYGAEGAMEKMTADLAGLYSTTQTPTVAQIEALGLSLPSLPTAISYPEYAFVVPNTAGVPISHSGTISAGPNQGLVAEIIPMTLQVSAQRASGAQVRLIRGVEVAMIPVFQFGVFSDSDLSYFPGPSFDFAGRVHTNGNLFLATQASTGLIFHSKVSAVGEVIRAKLSNGLDTQSDNRTGPVYIPNAAGGCDYSHPATNCINLAMNQGSKVAGPTSADNSGWIQTSTTTFASWLTNGKTGARALSLPFVAAGLNPEQIIRRPASGESPQSPVGQSRLSNLAQIRILLSDNPADLHLGGGATDANDVELNNTGVFATGVPVPGVAGGGNTKFGWANNDQNNNGLKPYYDLDYVTPLSDIPRGSGSYVGARQWPLIEGYLRVEVRKGDGTWIAVTQEWLKLGFARGLQVPSTEAGVANSVHSNAILILQMQADRNLDGLLNGANESAAITGNNSEFWWLPLNFYDAREGEVRDVAGNPAASCAPNGVMNAVEIDVSNLRRWLKGTIGTTGTQVDSTVQNGYVLYFSDRRGMLPDPHTTPAALTGQYGFEDNVNAASSPGTPNGQRESDNPGTSQSPEDVDQDKALDFWGAANVGDAWGSTFFTATHAAVPNPFSPRIATCTATARKNRVSGARRVLKLVNGSQGNLPTKPDGSGGFTVASENPVYIQGNYNASNAGWTEPHASAAVIADAVTLLSTKWTDGLSLQNPTQMTNRVANTTWYRVAVAAGKNLSFPRPTGWSAATDFGTDGGLHNFLRFLENWNGKTLNYQGSLISLYYSQYATGIFKCCTTVYNAPTRAYSFDSLFLIPSNLPPGTPSFRDLVNLSYRQDFLPY